MVVGRVWEDDCVGTLTRALGCEHTLSLQLHHAIEAETALQTALRAGGWIVVVGTSDGTQRAT